MRKIITASAVAIAALATTLSAIVPAQAAVPPSAHHLVNASTRLCLTAGPGYATVIGFRCGRSTGQMWALRHGRLVTRSRYGRRALCLTVVRSAFVAARTCGQARQRWTRHGRHLVAGSGRCLFMARTSPVGWPLATVARCGEPDGTERWSR